MPKGGTPRATFQTPSCAPSRGTSGKHKHARAHPPPSKPPVGQMDRHRQPPAQGTRIACESRGVTQLQAVKSNTGTHKCSYTPQHGAVRVQSPRVPPAPGGAHGQGRQTAGGRRAGGFPANFWEMTPRCWNSAHTRFTQFRLQDTLSLLTALQQQVRVHLAPENQPLVCPGATSTERLNTAGEATFSAQAAATHRSRRHGDPARKASPAQSTTGGRDTLPQPSCPTEHRDPITQQTWRGLCFSFLSNENTDLA